MYLCVDATIIVKDEEAMILGGNCDRMTEKEEWKRGGWKSM